MCPSAVSEVEPHASRGARTVPGGEPPAREAPTRQEDTGGKLERRLRPCNPGHSFGNPRSAGTARGPPLLARHVLEASGGTDVLKPLPPGGFPALLVVPSKAFSTVREKQ